ncbi:MAG: WD40 repeat domain-containing protein [Pirellulales bacterium]|nr:WD40 repeat domain-containing protein [Pirellulales bacterium]
MTRFHRIQVVGLGMIGLGLMILSAGDASAATAVPRVEAVQVIDLDPETRPDHAPVVTGLSIGPSGALMATSGDDHLIRVWSLPRGDILKRIGGHADWVRTAQFSHDGQWLATAGDDRRVRIWTLDGKTPRHSIATPDQVIYTLAFSPDDSILAAAGYSGQILLIDPKTGQTLRTLEGPGSEIRALAFSPDGRLLAAAGRTGLIRLFNPADGTQIRDLVDHTRPVRALLFAQTPSTDPNEPSKRSLLSAGDDRQIRIWDLDTGRAEALPELPTKIFALALCPDGRLASGGSDNAIRIWDLASRQEVARLVGHTGSVAELVWNPVENVLLSGSFDTTVRVWRLPDRPTERISRQFNTEIGAK